MVVNFMIIGAQKCGTTDLADRLSRHREISFCSVKEPGFFHKTPRWEDRIATYHALFPHTPGTLLGEGSTMYSAFPEYRDTPHRLHRYNPELKLIYIMRQPVDRIVSHYAHRLGHKRACLAPEQELFQDPTYVNRSRYALQVRPFLELFGAEQVLLLLFEEYIADPDTTMERVARFLGVSPEGFSFETERSPANPSVGQTRWGPVMRKITRNRHLRKIGAAVPLAARDRLRRAVGVTLREKPAVSEEVKHDLWRLLEDDVAALEGLMGRELAIWRKNYPDTSR
ncbi:hypothetical protein AU468_12365 [Alkalispirochaeta sphaeroplastigenens]|uniref:Sulfotransferase domain-containing protein n=1 Tax=Alkalispirochaeta sphaeroplastigenens TaxID=1187066 RepID=A0A2S4JGK5_9SPIO|nr:sulfotransferase domain-containing protein [Alkalispirochaeta sphaeroplastigenens]POQ98651.1 hypothetical protein AU468_12365 [Alkalispirochaeta sphaeroplastigenens]